MGQHLKQNGITAKAQTIVRDHYLGQVLTTWRVSFLAILAPGIGSIFVFFVPAYVVAKLISRLVEQPQIHAATLLLYVGLIGATWLLGEIFWRIGFFMESKSVSRSMQSLYQTAMDEMLQKDIGFFNDNFTGSLTKNVGAYARNYERFFDSIALQISPNIITTAFAAVVLCFYSPWLGLLLIGMMLFTLATVMPLIRRRQKLVAIRESASTHLTGHVADVISNAHAVRSFANEHNELATHYSNVTDYITKVKHSWDYQITVVDIVVSFLYVLTNVLGLTLVILLGSSSGHITTESILVTFGFFGAATRALFDFNSIYKDMETSLTEGAQFTQYLIDKPLITDTASEQLRVNDARIDFEDVHFTYPEKPDKPVFDMLNIHIKAGEHVGLIGRSGSGKTTITKLLLRFMDVDSGSISIDGQNITDVTQHSLRQAISYVPQEPALFHRSLADNIRYSNPAASQQAVQKAAELAHAHEFIKELPDGYKTLVGERGVKLSGGQRQRVAIARAMIKDAPILLLDEATSALDSESETLIQDALRKLMDGKTAIVIAHRLSTIQKMDRIIVLDNGKIVEQGCHTDLLKNNGAYAKLWSHQSGGFLGES